MSIIKPEQESCNIIQLARREHGIQIMNVLKWGGQASISYPKKPKKKEDGDFRWNVKCQRKHPKEVPIHFGYKWHEEITNLWIYNSEKEKYLTRTQNQNLRKLIFGWEI